MRAHRLIPSVSSIKHLQDCLEGMHGVQQARLLAARAHTAAMPTSSPARAVIAQLATQKATKLVPRPLTQGEPSPSRPKQRAVPVVVVSASSDGHSDVDTVPTIPRKGPTGKRSASASPKPTPASARQPTHSPSVKAVSVKAPSSDSDGESGPVAARLKRRRPPTIAPPRAEDVNTCGALSDGSGDEGDGLSVDGFDYDATLAQLAECLSPHVASDLMGFDPLAGVCSFVCVCVRVFGCVCVSVRNRGIECASVFVLLLCLMRVCVLWVLRLRTRVKIAFLATLRAIEVCVIALTFACALPPRRAGRAPLSPIDYCSHCGLEGNRRHVSRLCTNCGCKLAAKVSHTMSLCVAGLCSLWRVCACAD